MSDGALPNKTILIADDEPHLIRSLSYVLKREGYRVESALDGPEAMSKIESFRPDLVFLDLILPRMDGFEICRRIKNRGDLRSIYVIILTAKGQGADRKRGLEAGADAFMTKPFSPKEIIDTLRRVFGSSDSPSDPPRL
ncbi:MAG: response regulator [Nitrospirae bacterium]|nr:response regulator [Nitrospirota bacterium]